MSQYTLNSINIIHYCCFMQFTFWILGYCGFVASPRYFSLLGFLFLFLLYQSFCLPWLYFLPCTSLLILMLPLVFIHHILCCVYISHLYIFQFFVSVLCLCLGHMWKQVQGDLDLLSKIYILAVWLLRLLSFLSLSCSVTFLKGTLLLGRK